MTPDRRTDRRTETDAYEPTVHKHRCAKKTVTQYVQTQSGIFPDSEMMLEQHLLCHGCSFDCITAGTLTDQQIPNTWT